MAIGDAARGLVGLLVGMVLALGISGCGQGGVGLAVGPEGLDELLRFPAPSRAASPDAEVKPIARRPGAGGFYTVLLCHPKDGASLHYRDTNSNRSFSELGARLAAPGVRVHYQSAYGPLNGVQVAGALLRAAEAWEGAVGDRRLFEARHHETGSAGPERDGRNVVGWRRFVGEGIDALAATWIWDNGEQVVEFDTFFNLRHPWAVNRPIRPGEARAGREGAYDLQAVATHEVGHRMGLGHVIVDADESNGDETDATLHCAIGMGELCAQTLTPGDIAGARAVAPAGRDRCDEEGEDDDG